MYPTGDSAGFHDRYRTSVTRDGDVTENMAAKLPPRQIDADRAVADASIRIIDDRTALLEGDGVAARFVQNCTLSLAAQAKQHSRLPMGR